MLKFVIQKHVRPTDTHWDLMLEWPDSDKLKTWRIEEPPENWNTGPLKAEQIFDHDKKFLTYQGPVNKNTATVEIADAGTVEIISEKENQIEITLTGKIIKSNFTLNI